MARAGSGFLEGVETGLGLGFCGGGEGGFFFGLDEVFDMGHGLVEDGRSFGLGGTQGCGGIGEVFGDGVGLGVGGGPGFGELGGEGVDFIMGELEFVGGGFVDVALFVDEGEEVGDFLLGGGVGCGGGVEVGFGGGELGVVGGGRGLLGAQGEWEEECAGEKQDAGIHGGRMTVQGFMFKVCRHRPSTSPGVE